MHKNIDKISYSFPFPGYFKEFSEYEKLFKRITQMGYIGIEPAICNPDRIDINILKRSMDKNNIKLTAIGTGDAFSENGLSFSDKDLSIRKQAVERIKKDILFAREFGAKVLIGRIQGILKNIEEKKDCEKRIIECIKKITEFAEENSVIIALEPVNHFMVGFNNKIDDVLRIIDLIGSEYLGILLDTFHMNIEERSLVDGIKKAGGLIYHFHLSDSNRGPLGTGNINFKLVINTLEENGYDGYYSIEVEFNPNIIIAAEISMNYIKNILFID